MRAQFKNDTLLPYLICILRCLVTDERLAAVYLYIQIDLLTPPRSADEDVLMPLGLNVDIIRLATELDTYNYVHRSTTNLESAV
jgi:hypothetical protein